MKTNFFKWSLTGVNYMYFLGPKVKNAFYDGTPSSCTIHLVKIFGELFTDHKSSNSSN